MNQIVLQVQRQTNGTYSVFHVDGWTVTVGLQPQNYDIIADQMAADFGGEWEEIPAAVEESD